MRINRTAMVRKFLKDGISMDAPAWKAALRIMFFRTAWYSDDHQELEKIFQAMKDPWNFQSSLYEHERFNVLLEEAVKCPHESVLEVGCAEALFTSMLTLRSQRVVGIDVSPTAISRARERCPEATFFAVSLEEFNDDEKFDLVICAETLYYVKDVRSALERLSLLGRRCLVSYLEREARRLDPYVNQIPGSRILRCDVGSGLQKHRIVVVTWDNGSAESGTVSGSITFAQTGAPSPITFKEN
jgi:SAM-dependent methyltransferase